MDYKGARRVYKKYATSNEQVVIEKDGILVHASGDEEISRGWFVYRVTKDGKLYDPRMIGF